MLNGCLGMACPCLCLKGKMNIIITGGCGFIGSHIADKLLDAGHSVAVIDNLATGDIKNLNPGARFYECDIRDGKIEEIFIKEQPETVFHLAAQINVRKSEEDPFSDIDININGSVNIIKHFVALKGEKKLVFASTGGAIYGEASLLPTPETAEPFPLSPYGISKLAVEKYLFYFAAFYGLNFAALRFGNVYGPRQNASSEAGVVAIFTEKLLNKQIPVIFGDGRQTRDFVYIDDVVDANIMAVQKDIKGIFNIGTGIETDINSVFDYIQKEVGSSAKKIYGRPQKGDIKRSCLSSGKMKKISGWKPSLNIEEGIKKTVRWFSSVRS